MDNLSEFSVSISETNSQYLFSNKELKPALGPEYSVPAIGCEGIKKTFWPARMQKIESGKLKSIIGQDFEIWLDGGHNEHASDMLLDNIKKWKEENLFLIFGMLSNKEPREFLNKIIHYFRCIYVVPIVNHSFFSTQQIKKIYKDKKDIIKPSSSVVETLRALKRDYKKGKIIICGSLYLAGDILKENESLID